MNFRYQDLNKELFDKVVAFSYSIGSGLGGPGAIIMLSRDGNGRFVRRMLEEAEMNLAERLMKLKESEITKELISTIEVCDIPDLSTRKRPEKRKLGFAC